MIHIFYRHSQAESFGRERPEGFSYKKCFENLKQTTSGRDDVSITMVYDGVDCSDDSVVAIAKKYPLIQTTHGSSLLSYRDLLTHIKDRKDVEENDLIYFLENDYLHVENWVDVVNCLYNTYDVSTSYVSLYDHNDKYTHPMYSDLVSKVFVTEKCHWRTTPSTCGSFIITKKLFDLDYDIWSTTIGDHNTFLHLNQTRSRFVFTPIPGLSTHCMEGLMSPTINWKQINEK